MKGFFSLLNPLFIEPPNKESIMKKIIALLILGCFVLLPTLLFARDVRVKGYYRKDGTYVRPHIRSSPDSFKWNNYGPSKNSNQLMNPRSRDYDHDGIPNYLDRDSDNDGILDDNDSNPYGGSYNRKIERIPSKAPALNPGQYSTKPEAYQYGKPNKDYSSPVDSPQFKVYFKNGRELTCDNAWRDGDTIFLAVHGKKIAIGYSEGEIDMKKSFK